ncbi:DUF2292 domain-containing protein [Abiotrophia defectiva]
MDAKKHDAVQEKLAQGFIALAKDGKISLIEPPRYGEITIIYQDGKPVRADKRESNKL